LNDCVRIVINEIGRTTIDPKYLSCLIVDKIEKTNIFFMLINWSVWCTRKHI
jgi:hypothetical protein